MDVVEKEKEAGVLNAAERVLGWGDLARSINSSSGGRV